MSHPSFLVEIIGDQVKITPSNGASMLAGPTILRIAAQTIEKELGLEQEPTYADQ